MSEDSTQTTITAESQIDLHIRENYEQVRIERGLTWEQMAEQFGRDRNGDFLQAWALERASGKAPEGIESRGDLTDDMRNADAPKKARRGNVKDLDPETT